MKTESSTNSFVLEAMMSVERASASLSAERLLTPMEAQSMPKIEQTAGPSFDFKFRSASPWWIQFLQQQESMSDGKKSALAKRPEILLVEDDPQIRRFLKAMLIAEDYRFHEAARGEDGIAQASARNPDLIL